MEQNISLQIGDTSLLRSKKIRFYFEIALLYILIFTRSILEISIPVSLILVFTALIALDNGRDEIIALCICCIPLGTAFQYKYLLLLCTLIYVMKYPKDIRISYRVLPLLLMMAWELLHGGRYSFSFYEFLRNFSELFFCSFLLRFKLLLRPSDPVHKIYSSSSCLSVSVGILVSTGYDRVV